MNNRDSKDVFLYHFDAESGRVSENWMRRLGDVTLRENGREKDFLLREERERE